MLIEKIVEDEMLMMDRYRRDYGWSNDSEIRNINDYAPMASILHEWDAQKSKYLSRLFGGELTLSRKINYQKSYEELQDALADMMDEYCHHGRVGRNGSEFVRAWNDYMYQNRYEFTNEQTDGLNRLMSDDCLISNVYDGRSFEIEQANGKFFRINNGCKTSKTLGKLAAIFNLPGWEDFRICHSLILNQKGLGGTLTISIHPLDYMTMSDNSYDWESCMSWANEGGYRQGTVEMMNSPSVIVAYLSGEEPYRIAGRDWNSKKWRQLFVVDERLIVGVKDYPYHNENLGMEVMKWLRELAEKNLGWTYLETEKYTVDSKKLHVGYLPEEYQDFYLDFNTQAMYNDFGCLDYHWLMISDNLTTDDFGSHYRRSESKYLYIPYSGRSQCMICGSTDVDFEDESCLACEECQDRQRCDCCGEIAGEVYEIDGIRLCSYCWDNRVHACAGCGKEHYDENMMSIFIIPRLTIEEQKPLREEYIENHYWSCSFASRREEFEQAEFNFFSEDADIWLCECNEGCFEKWIAENMNPGCRPHRREMRWTSDICVYFDELTDEAKENYCWGYDNNPELYKTRFPLRRAEPTRFIELL